ncbi:Oxidoreductase short-chain dehydrogenase/reductase family [Penicillium solitum]|uniref:Oxidoreductase short-chain dehydrogenase/reductase family n=1 Tax=Penicillium solitum TaxID=60172 RepID=UPI0032C45364|nr:Oxidoreductase short-chain dehydrogenase/reductase family [Penicillium solitum]
MAFPYKHVLLVGATSGIGRAMADRLIQAGIKVTARLEEFVEKYGEEKASAMNYDVSDINGAPQFAAESVGEHFEI